MRNPSGAPNMVWGMYVLIALNRVYGIKLSPRKISALPGWISVQTGTRLVIDALEKKFGALGYHDPRVQTVIEMAKSMELVKDNPRRVRQNIFTFNNPTSGPADSTAAHELELYIDNDAQLYRSQFIPIVKNLMLKRRKGVYNRELAVKLFMYLMDAGAKKYLKEFGTGGNIDTVFNRNTRLQAARAFRDSFETEAELGNYDRLIGPVSNPRRSAVRENIYTFNNPRGSRYGREWSVERAARAVGLYVATWSPGDGVTRYRFFKQNKSYFEGDGIYTALGKKEALNFLHSYAMGHDSRSNPSRAARSFISSKIGRLRHEGYPAKKAAAISYSMARKMGYKVNGGVCANPVIRGDKLPENLKREVLNAFIYRWTSGNTRRAEVYGYCPHCKTPGGKPSETNIACRQKHPTIPLVTDAQWLRQHAFHVTNDGRLDPRHHHAEPYFMADNWKKGDPLPNPLLQTVFAANPPISAEWNRLTGRQKLELLELAGFPTDYASSLAWRSWNTLVPSARRALEERWLDTSSRGTTRRRVAAPVGTNPLTVHESASGLMSSKRDFRSGQASVGKVQKAYYFGKAIGEAAMVEKFGTNKASKVSRKIINRSVSGLPVFSNPGVRLPRPGTRLTVAQALELAQRLGNRSLVKQCHAAMRLQKASDRNTKCVVWKHLPIGSKNHLDGVVAMTHYGRSPEDMYTPPKGSKKGPHMYRHRWKKHVDVLASPSGKAIVKLMGPGQKVGDWMRG